jgi:hypothetical protein
MNDVANKMLLTKAYLITNLVKNVSIDDDFSSIMNSVRNLQ